MIYILSPLLLRSFPPVLFFEFSTLSPLSLSLLPWTLILWVLFLEFSSSSSRVLFIDSFSLESSSLAFTNSKREDSKWRTQGIELEEAFLGLFLEIPSLSSLHGIIFLEFITLSPLFLGFLPRALFLELSFIELFFEFPFTSILLWVLFSEFISQQNLNIDPMSWNHFLHFLQLATPEFFSASAAPFPRLPFPFLLQSVRWLLKCEVHYFLWRPLICAKFQICTLFHVLSIRPSTPTWCQQFTPWRTGGEGERQTTAAMGAREYVVHTRWYTSVNQM